MDKTPKANMPKAKFRIGAITATVWENKGQTKEGKEFINKSVALKRSYKDAKGEWQETDSYKQNDIPKAILALQKAYEFLATEPKATTEEED